MPNNSSTWPAPTIFLTIAKGQKPVDGEDRSHSKTKAAVVVYLKKSFAGGAEVIQMKGDSGMMQVVVTPKSHTTVPLGALAHGLLEHCGEHTDISSLLSRGGYGATGIAAR